MVVPPVHDQDVPVPFPIEDSIGWPTQMLRRAAWFGAIFFIL
jgi:hypothetical protein